MLAELSRRERDAKIKPDPDLDIYMKVKIWSSTHNKHFESFMVEIKVKSELSTYHCFVVIQAAATKGQEASVVTDYTLKVWQIKIRDKPTSVRV